MASKRMANTWLLVIVGVALVLFLLVMVSGSNEHYTAITERPTLDKKSQPQDGDTQADTIKALQAYAKAAVNKAERLHETTRLQSRQVTEQGNSLRDLEHNNQALKAALEQLTSRATLLEKNVATLKQTSTTVPRGKGAVKGPITHPNDIPVGFGFDELSQRAQSPPLGNPNVGAWHNPIDRVVSDNKSDAQKGFSGLLSRPGRNKSRLTSAPKQQATKAVVEPMYTIAKDAVLTDAIAMTALIGRIPVDGKTPDPYPIKLFIGRENLLANGHDLPEIEGMIFSGLGIGDWNLSCVSARLYSASYIFTDGTIVNHSSTSEPLGYISDPAGIPCVAGKFVTNAPQFLLKRAGLAGLGAAGAAYADAQQQTQTSALTGNTTRTILGDIDKLAAGTVVKSATDEVTQWLLERQKQSFDAVVVKPGVAVAIHLEKALAIDHDEQARKVRYGGNDEAISTLD